MNLRISWLAIVALVALFYVLVSGLANPRTRPFIIGLGALVGLGSFFLFFARQAVVHQVELPRSIVTDRVPLPAGYGEKANSPPERPSPVVIDRVAPSITMSASAPALAKNSATSETKRPKMTVIAALRQAIVQEWKARASAPVAEAPEKPAKTSPPNVPAKPQPPAWVNAEPKVEGNCYTMSVHVGPFTTPLECERELPKTVQGVVAEYAELLLGREAALVRLPDGALQQLVRERWPEVRPMEIDGGNQEMFSLHALVVFDNSVQQKIMTEAQRLVIGRRVQGGAVVFGGVLGLLALAWGGMKLATRKKMVQTT